MVGGIVALFSVYSYAKLGVTFPSRGGAARFLNRCFGDGEGWIGIFLAAGLLYVTYEGFGVVTNSAGDMTDPRRQLPRAMYQAIAIVVVAYVTVSSVIILVLDLDAINANSGHVLATAASEILGKAGLIIIGVAALLASVSGINATLYGDANLAYLVARRHELPRGLAYSFWRNGTVGLVVAAGVACAFVVFFPLASVGQLASLAFLLVYGSVSVGHLRVRRQTGGRTVILVIAIGLNVALFCLLFGYSVIKGRR